MKRIYKLHAEPKMRCVVVTKANDKSSPLTRHLAKRHLAKRLSYCKLNFERARGEEAGCERLWGLAWEPDLRIDLISQDQVSSESLHRALIRHGLAKSQFFSVK